MSLNFNSLFIGLVLALIYVELTGISPGGLIVPGYFALYLEQPDRVLATLAVAFLVLGTYRLAFRYFIIFGRRRFVLMILAGAVFGQLWSWLMPALFSEPVGLRVIGWVVPGLLAYNLDRQKISLTLASLAIVSVLTFFLVHLLG